LLDLAFVLLVIFIITTTPIVNDLDLALPESSRHQKDSPRKANYITVESAGRVFLNKKQVELPELMETLAGLRMDDPDLNVIIRGDSKTKYSRIRSVLDICQRVNVAKVDLATEPAPSKSP
jgi:biopolymer transport protein ExbD